MGGWEKTAGAGFEVDEYTHVTGAVLRKVKTRRGSTKRWELVHVDGRIVDLGKRASFSHPAIIAIAR